MGEYQPAQTAAIRRGTRHRNKRLALSQTLLINVEDVPVVAPGLQSADDSGGEAMFGAGWIKNVGTFLAVQNAYGRDVDIGSLQILDCGVGGLFVRQECCQLVDGSMAELIDIGQRALGHVLSSRGHRFQDTLGRRKSRQNLGSTGSQTFTPWKSWRSIDF